MLDALTTREQDMTASETSFGEAELSAVESLSEIMETTAALTELQVFRLRQAANSISRDILRREGRLNRVSNSCFRDVNDRYGKVQDYWSNAKYLCEAATASFHDRVTLGHDLNLPVMSQLSSLLKQNGCQLLARRLDAAAQRHPSLYRRPIRHLVADGRLNGLQACAPRLRVIFKGVVIIGGVRYADFDTVCEECGGSDLSMPDGELPSGPVICEACEHVLGSKAAVEKLARYFSTAAMQNL